MKTWEVFTVETNGVVNVSYKPVTDRIAELEADGWKIHSVGAEPGGSVSVMIVCWKTE